MRADHYDAEIAQKQNFDLDMCAVLCNTKICNCILFANICATDIDENSIMWYDEPIKGRAAGGPKRGKVGIVVSEAISLNHHA